MACNLSMSKPALRINMFSNECRPVLTCKHSTSTAGCKHTQLPQKLGDSSIERQFAAPSWPPQVYSQLEGDTSHVVNTAWALLTLVRGGCGDHAVSRLVPAVHLADTVWMTPGDNTGYWWRWLAMVVKTAYQCPTGAAGKTLDMSAACRPWQQQRGA